MSSTSPSTVTQEFTVRVPKNSKKRYNVMRFHGSTKVDVSKWSQVKLERENNMKDFKTEEDMPKYGAGSEYGREQREEARRKKYGITLKKYNPEEQPWCLKVGGKAGKKYRGVREGGIATNASYYVFVKAADGAFEAYPVDEWYNFTPVTTYKTLNAEEAEEEFGKRDTVYNYFSIMRKRLKNGEEEEKTEDGEKTKKKKGGKYGTGSGDLKISDMDEWIASSEEESDPEAAVGDSSNEKKKKDKKKPKGKKGKKKKTDSDEEARESSDGEDEGREVDYISDESSSADEGPEDSAKSLKGVEDEDAIRKMDESETDEENAEEKKENPEETKEEASPNKATKDKKDSKKTAASSSESSSDTSDSDDFDNDTTFQSALFVSKSKKKESGGRGSSRSNTPTVDKKESKSERSKAQKRKLASSGKNNEDRSPPVKKSKSQAIAHGVMQSGSSSSLSPSSSRSIADFSNEGITEEAIRRYLMRKPMTTTEILQKFKNKKTNMTREQLVNTVAQVLKRLDPEKHMVKGKMYLSLKLNQ